MSLNIYFVIYVLASFVGFSDESGIEKYNCETINEKLFTFCRIDPEQRELILNELINIQVEETCKISLIETLLGDQFIVCLSKLEIQLVRKLSDKWFDVGDLQSVKLAGVYQLNKYAYEIAKLADPDLRVFKRWCLKFIKIKNIN